MNRRDRRERRDIQSKEINKITEKIIGAAISVHRILGPGLLESTYEACMVSELSEKFKSAATKTTSGDLQKCATRLWIPNRSSC